MAGPVGPANLSAQPQPPWLDGPFGQVVNGASLLTNNTALLYGGHVLQLLTI